MKQMANQSRMTMSGLAKLSGVDISTVSRALNNSPLVNGKTKDHIMKLAHETGYAINARARNLRKQSSQTLGIVIPVYPGSQQNLSDPFFLEMIAAVSQAAAKFDYDLIINLPNSPSETCRTAIIIVRKSRWLDCYRVKPDALKRLRSLGDATDRVVVWGGMIDAAHYTLVGSDNFEGGRLVGGHLKNIGRHRVVFLGDIDLPEVELRYNGLMSVWNGDDADHSVMHVRSSFDGHEAYRQTLALCESAQSFDAIFAASDVLAIAAIHALQSKGLRVPEDVAVVGYDNIGQAAMISPGLTTIDQNIKLGGEILVNTLVDKIAGNPVRATLTPTKLVIRGSTVSL